LPPARVFVASSRRFLLRRWRSHQAPVGSLPKPGGWCLSCGSPIATAPCNGRACLGFVVGPRAGERLGDPTVADSGRCIRLHTLLGTPGVHVLLHRDAPTLDLGPLGLHVLVHRLARGPGGGVVAVRPDGYVGFRYGTADVAQLRTWLNQLGATEPAGHDHELMVHDGTPPSATSVTRGEVG
jgi:hypothetical protein